MKRTAFAIGAILSSALIMACGTDMGPTNGTGGGGGGGVSIAGNYTATKWVTTDASSGATDHLLGGSTLTITLNANGSTSGHMHMVASSSNPSLDADMVGSWILGGGTVHFNQNADTFVTDMQFGVVANGAKWLLEGDEVFQGTRIQLTLTQL